MKRTFCLVCLIVSISSFAQEIVYSTKQKINNKTPRFSIIGKNNDGVVLRRYGRSTNILDVFDNNLNYEYSVPVNPRRQNAYTKGILLNPFGATTLFIAPEKDHSILYARILRKRFEVDGSPEITLDTIFDGKEQVIQDYRYVLSQDKSKILFYYPYYKGNALSAVQVKVYTRDLVLLQRRTIPVEENDNIEIVSIHPILKNNGEVIFYLMDNTKNKRSAFFVSSVHQHYLRQDGYAQKKIRIDKVLYGNVDFKYDEVNHHVCMSGLISSTDKKTRKSSIGYFVNFIDPDSAMIEQEIVKNYSSQFIYELTGKDSTQQSRKLSTFNLEKLILRKDGGAILILESYFTENDQISYPIGGNSSFSNFRTYNVFYYNDIICISIGPDGKEDWTSILRKKQISENDNGIYSSFGLMVEKDQLNFIYLDEIYYNSNINNYALSSDGNIRREKLFNQSEESVMLIPKLSRQISKNVVIIPSLRKNMLSMVKIEF